MKRHMMGAVGGLALALSWAPSMALDPVVSSALVVGATANLAATMLGSGLPALQADRRRDEYVLQTVEHLQRGQIVIREGQNKLAKMLNELGDRVPEEMRAELDELIENQVTGVADLMISDMNSVNSGTTPLIAPGERLETFQTQIATYMQRASGRMGLGVAGWSLTIELAFMEANREAFMRERGLYSMEEGYRDRVRDYFEYFVRAFDPERPDSLRARLDREQHTLNQDLENLEAMLMEIKAAVNKLPELEELDYAIRYYAPISPYFYCLGSDGSRPFERESIETDSPELYDARESLREIENIQYKYNRILIRYLNNDSAVRDMSSAIGPVMQSVEQRANMRLHLADALDRVRSLFEGLVSVQLIAGSLVGRTVGLGIDNEMMEKIVSPAQSNGTVITRIMTRAQVALEDARIALENFGSQRRRSARESLNQISSPTRIYVECRSRKWRE